MKNVGVAEFIQDQTVRKGFMKKFVLFGAMFLGTLSAFAQSETSESESFRDEFSFNFGRDTVASRRVRYGMYTLNLYVSGIEARARVRRDFDGATYDISLNGHIGSDLQGIVYRGTLYVVGIAAPGMGHDNEIWYTPVDASLRPTGWRFQGGKALRILRYYFSPRDPISIEVIGMDGNRWRQREGQNWIQF